MTARNLALTPAHTHELNDTALAKAYRKQASQASWAKWKRRAEYAALCAAVVVLAGAVALISGAFAAPELAIFGQEIAR